MVYEFHNLQYGELVWKELLYDPIKSLIKTPSHSLIIMMSVKSNLPSHTYCTLSIINRPEYSHEAYHSLCSLVHHYRQLLSSVAMVILSTQLKMWCSDSHVTGNVSSCAGQIYIYIYGHIRIYAHTQSFWSSLHLRLFPQHRDSAS